MSVAKSKEKVPLTVKGNKQSPDAYVLRDLLADLKATGAQPWVKENTAVLIVHGIGNQLPIQTLDQFGKGLVNEFLELFGTHPKLEHKLMCKTDGDGAWFDNVLRLSKEGESAYIDLYEYYWANYTEDKASWSDINAWIQGVVDNSQKFYEYKQQMGEECGDKSYFFVDGKFHYRRYKFLLLTVSKVYFVIDSLIKFFLLLLSYLPLPFVGRLAKRLFEKYIGQGTNKLSNVLGDIVVYNVTDPKCKFYIHRRKILDGAVSALRYLFEKQQADRHSYPSIIVAGHSLGSQIAYDAINRINLLANAGQIQHYDETGCCTKSREEKHSIGKRLKGFVTFGSPLDKIAFFVRESDESENYIRQQILEYYHSFKAKTFKGRKSDLPYINRTITRLFENTLWKNYYDESDYVSGRLDYYEEVVNIDCSFKKARFFNFTHSEYWTCKDFYADMIYTFLNTKQGEPAVLFQEMARDRCCEKRRKSSEEKREATIQ